jgi:hypothetical protein
MQHGISQIIRARRPLGCRLSYGVRLVRLAEVVGQAASE